MILAALMPGRSTALFKRRSVTRGVWWDIAASTTMADMPGYVAKLKAFGIRDVMVMAQDLDEPEYRLRWTPAQLKAFATAVHAEGMAFGIALWPAPTRAYLDQMIFGSDGSPSLRSLQVLTRADALEFDIESNNWSADKMVGFASQDECAAAFAEVLTAAAGRGAVAGSTTYPSSLSRDGFIAKLAKRLNYQAVQSYSHASKYPWDGPYGPGKMQRLGAEKVAALGVPNVIIGLGAWDQAYPGHTIREAMQIAYQTAFDLGAKNVRYWSAKWILTSRANPEVQDFIASTR